MIAPLPTHTQVSRQSTQGEIVQDILSWHAGTIGDYLFCDIEDLVVVSSPYLSMNDALLELFTGSSPSVRTNTDPVMAEFQTLLLQSIEDFKVHPTVTPWIVKFEDRPWRHPMYAQSSMALTAMNQQDPGLFTTFSIEGTRMLYFTSTWTHASTLPEIRCYFALKRKHLQVLVNFIDRLRRDRLFSASLHSYGCADMYVSETVRKTSWADVTLSAEVLASVKDDCDTFFARKKWFIDQRLPYKRGYLFHGPPGNGKTSAVRAILSHYKLNAYAPQLCSAKMTDSDFLKIVAKAKSEAPAVLLLEDLDRAFPKTGEQGKVSMQQLLNSIDGVSESEGLIVIATANEPEVLNDAILRRPGRFDRVVLFSNPDEALRREYFLKRQSSLAQDERFDELLHETESFSFAQLQETYVAAGSAAFTAKHEISLGDLVAGAVSIKNGNTGVKRRSVVKGFSGA